LLAIPFLSGSISIELYLATLACFPTVLLFTLAAGNSRIGHLPGRGDGAGVDGGDHGCAQSGGAGSVRIGLAIEWKGAISGGLALP